MTKDKTTGANKGMTTAERHAAERAARQKAASDNMPKSRMEAANAQRRKVTEALAKIDRRVASGTVSGDQVATQNAGGDSSEPGCLFGWLSFFRRQKPVENTPVTAFLDASMPAVLRSITLQLVAHGEDVAVKVTLPNAQVAELFAKALDAKIWSESEGKGYHAKHASDKETHVFIVEGLNNAAQLAAEFSASKKDEVKTMMNGALNNSPVYKQNADFRKIYSDAVVQYKGLAAASAQR